MNNDSLNTEIITINSNDFDKMFEETPNNTVTANNLAVAKEELKSNDEAKLNFDNQVEQNIVPIDVDNLDKEDTTTEIKNENEEIVEEEKKEKKEKQSTIKSESDNINYNDIVSYLIETETFADFNGREELEIDNDIFKNLLKTQVEYKVKNMFDELLDSTGDYGKAIISHTKNGGNPDEVIDLFKEEKSIQNIDTKTEEGKISKIKKCYSELYGWKEEKINRYIDKLIVDDELDAELEDVNEKFDSYYKDELDKINREQLEHNKQQEEREKAFKKNINETLSIRKDLNEKDKNKVLDYILNFNEKLPDGTAVNKFYLDFAKVQSSPQDYVDLALFIMDKNKFIEKIAKQKETEVTKKTFDFVKGNSTVNSTRGSSHVEKLKQVEEFNFGLIKK